MFQVSLNGKVVSSKLDIFRLVGTSQAFDMSLTFFFTGEAIKISPQIQVTPLLDCHAHLGLAESAVRFAKKSLAWVFIAKHLGLCVYSGNPSLDYESTIAL